MARPKKTRRLKGLPEPVIYTSGRVGGETDEPMEVALDDFEIMRLVDSRGYTIEEAAMQVGVSRSTAGRMLQRCRRTLAQSIEARVSFCLDAGPDLQMDSAGTEGELLESRIGKLAVACHECSDQSSVARIFGRAPGFVVVSENGNKRHRVSNPGYRAKRNAAGKATELLNRLGVKLVIAGKFGEEALRQLSESGIRTQVASGLSIDQALEFFSTEKTNGTNSKI